jgi:hypothetical protein
MEILVEETARQLYDFWMWEDIRKARTARENKESLKILAQSNSEVIWSHQQVLNRDQHEEGCVSTVWRIWTAQAARLDWHGYKGWVYIQLLATLSRLCPHHRAGKNKMKDEQNEKIKEMEKKRKK